MRLHDRGHRLAHHALRPLAVACTILAANSLLSSTLSSELIAVVPAKAGTHIPEPVVMGPRFRGDDSI